MNKSENLVPVLGRVVRCVLLVLFISGFLSSPLSAQVNADGIQEEQDYAFAYGLYQDRLYQLAADQFQKFIDQHASSSKRPDAILLYAECRFALGNYPEAISVYKSFAREFPREKLRPDALFRIGEANLKLQRYGEAIPSYKEIIATYGENSIAGEAAYWIGESFFKLGRMDSAAAYYALCVEKYPTNRLSDYALYSLGWTAEGQKDFPKAIGYYQKLLDGKKQSTLVPTATVRIGECYNKTGEFQKSIDFLSSVKMAAGDSSENAQIDYLVAEDYYGLKNYVKARSLYEQFRKKYPADPLDRTVAYSIGWTYLKTNEYQQAAASFGELATGQDDVAYNALYRKAQAIRLSGDTKQALSIYAQVVTVRPQGDYVDNALYESGMIHYESKDYDAAISSFEQVTIKYPASDAAGESYRMLGESYLAKKEYANATKAFRAVGSAPAEDTVRAEAQFQEAWSLYKEGKFAEAAALFGGFQKQNPKSPRATESLFWGG